MKKKKKEYRKEVINDCYAEEEPKLVNLNSLDELSWSLIFNNQT